MDVVVSGNLIFHSCSNESCGYIRSDLYLPSNPLPVPVEEVITFLRNERREAEQSSSTIGWGRTIKQYTTEDRLGIIAELEIEVEEDQTIRPYDAVYYGRSLGVVMQRKERILKIIFDMMRKPPEEGDLRVSEPLMLYDSALEIIREKAPKHGKHLANIIEIPNVSPPALMTPQNLVFQDGYGLDPEKRDAVEKILSMPEWDGLIIEGPPGTGKTMVIAAAAVEAAKGGDRALITSHTNVAVDNALERILSLDPEIREKVARIGHPAKVSKRIKPLISGPSEAESRVAWMRRILREKQIIGMTIAKLAVLDIYGLMQVSMLEGIWPTFDYVFLDEASMIPLAVSVIPLFYSKRWVILGDTRQLPPIVRTRHAYAGSKSILELMESSRPERVYRLTVQRRGNMRIFGPVNELFYHGMLRHHPSVSRSSLKFSAKGKPQSKLSEALDPDKPLVWIDVEGGAMEWCRIRRGRVESASGANLAEALIVLKLYKELREAGVRRSDIAIITTYRAQANLIREALMELGIPEEPIIASLYREVVGRDFDVLKPDDPEDILDLRFAETIDSYQGREKECVIYSLTSHRYHKALADYRRMNVAITRAKSKLIIVSSLGTFWKLPWIKAIRDRSSRMSVTLTELVTEKEWTCILNVFRRLCKP